MEDKKQKWFDCYVNWQAFIWAVGILSTIALFSFGIAVTANNSVAEVKQKVETQNNDIQWIKQTLLEIKADIKEIK